MKKSVIKMKSVLVNIFYIITIIIVSSFAAPVSNVIANLKIEITKNCSSLLTTGLVVWDSAYIEPCQNSPTENLTDENRDAYLCLGILNANEQLCKLLSNKTHDSLPKNVNDVEDRVKKISLKSPSEPCTQFLNHNTSSELFSKYISNLNPYLHKNGTCQVMCGGVLEETNNLCSMMSLVYSIIEDINKTSTETPQKLVNASSETVPKMDDKKINNATVKISNTTKTTNITVPNNAVKSNPQENINKPVNVTSKVTQPNKISQPETVPDLPTLGENPPVANIVKSTKTTELISSEMPVTNEEIKDKNNIDQLDYNSPDLKGDYEDDIMENPKKDTKPPVEPKVEKIFPEENFKNNIGFDDTEDSNFFTYFMFISVVFICGYIAYHNKQKILALLLEGRRDRNSRRRPNTSNYRKLNSNLEEAVTSKSGGSAAHVIY